MTKSFVQIKAPEPLPTVSVFLQIVSPLLFYSLKFDESVIAASLAVLASAVTLIFFRVTKKLFPASCLKVSLLLWLAALAQAGWYLNQLLPLWTISSALWVLSIHEQGFESLDWKRFFRQAVWLLGGVFALSAVLSLLNRFFQLGIFQVPAGVFFLLAMGAIGLKSLEFRKIYA